MNLTIKVISKNCIGCGRCIRVCNSGTLGMDRASGIVYNTGIEWKNAGIACMHARQKH